MHPGESNPFPFDKTKYIECNEDRSVTSLKLCNPNQIFSTVSKSCVNEMNTNPLQADCPPMSCFNTGQCIPKENSKFECKCPRGFYGEQCEKFDTCTTFSPCGPNGLCIQMGLGVPISHICMCDKTHSFGLSCNDNSIESNPCSASDSNGQKFGVKFSKSVYITCVEGRPNLNFCPPPLVFTGSKFNCEYRF